jgi:hypothetical protein
MISFVRDRSFRTFVALSVLGGSAFVLEAGRRWPF